jgi:nitroimidazol reductase NimA-like FMN-containing flavoprotein (pyridoxamine 5'-phosphate oxidase superfamily)
MHEPVELTVEECLDLLNGGVVGRVAMATPMGPRIVPVNYAMYDGAIVFRTTPYSELGSYGRNIDLAFEIDHLDFDRQEGWSVVALGRAEMVEDPDELRTIRDGWDPTPWVAGPRHLYLKLRWREITGRRLAGDGTRGSVSPVPQAV